MAITDEDLQDIVVSLISKQGHETLRASLQNLFVYGLGVDRSKINFEVPLSELRGRIDALLGRSIIEIKVDLGRESKDARNQLLKYMRDKEKETGKKYIGIATDGAVFRLYVRKKLGQDEINDFLECKEEYKPDPKNSRGLLIWLESKLVLNDDLPPEAETIKQELGRDSQHYSNAREKIKYLWENLQDDSEVITKYDIWKRFLNTAYGSEVEEIDLFLQHTYLTIVAKSIATVALFPNLPDISGKDLLSGKEFEKNSVWGAIESDFFDWVLSHDAGDELVTNIVMHVKRFRWRDVETDILKILYENLMPPNQRHELGEYYTPDWLAERICREVITDPLEWRIIDPACGSGTFLFHALRLGLEHAVNNNIPLDEAIAKLTDNISGIDVHPIAVIFARITYLLALLPALQQSKKLVVDVNVQVYLGDSLQWGVSEIVGKKDLIIPVPAEKDSHHYLTDENNGNGNIILKFPYEIAEKPSLFDEIMKQIMDLADTQQDAKALEKRLPKDKLTENSVKMLCKTYSDLCKLQAEKRNHIWGYVARNLSRPVWLSGDSQKAHVVIGNPPWVRYSSMGNEIKSRFRDKMKEANLWVGGKSATGQDLSGYFFVKSCELYLQKGGTIAFVMPYAVMSRMPYKKFREMGVGNIHTKWPLFEIEKAWAFPSDVQPLFPVPSCVLFASHAPKYAKLPEQATYFSGNLPSLDANIEQAKKALTETLQAWPDDGESSQKSNYARKFRQGAILAPRRLVLIEPIPNPLGIVSSSPNIKGRAGTLDKEPWRNLTPPENRVEEEFIYPVYLGESIAPYCAFKPLDAVIPLDEKQKELMDWKQAQSKGYSHLAKWLEKVENIWESNKPNDSSFLERINHNNALSAQFPIAPLRIAYATSGSNLASTIIRDKMAIIDTTLYWMPIEKAEEGYYLLAILNSETARAAAEQWQAEGQWGKRHFHKTIFNLPIPEFSDKQALHVDLANAAKTAEKIAAKVEPEKDGEHFTRTRSHIRKELYKDGIAKEIDDLVATLLKITQ